ncbi:MAG: VOC family protein, partial [Polyangiaceae bacterium]
MAGRIRPVAIDHVVLVVADAQASLDWYVGVLGCTPERVDEWRAGEAPFPSVRVNDSAVIDLVEGERSGRNVDHFAIVVDPDVDLDEAAGAIEGASGPMDLWGARGN